jgi:hypothetical protein
MRQRGELVQMAGTHVQHMHKALTQRDPRIKAKPEIIQKSLVGNWQPQHLFTLKQSRRLYREYQQQIAECDAEIERLTT